MTMDLNHTSLYQLHEALRQRQLSSRELARAYLDRINRLDGSLGAFITLDEERTLAQADQADALIAQGKMGPLTGIPIAHKDIFCAQGWKTTCASKMLANFTAPYDAHVIELFNRAGAVILGKTNMDEFAMGSSNENSWFGPVKNPWDLAAVPGGSSGGSAAAVAARLAPVATATDTGGSIRQPASHCGISGIKPTYGRVSRYGMIAYASSLDQGGLMAPSAEDLAYTLSVMAGFDERDSTSVERAGEDYVAQLGQSLKGVRLGLPREYFGDGVSSGVAAAIAAAVDEFRRLGAEVVEVSLPHSHLSVPVYYVLAPAEASSNLSRYDGVRYGHRADQYGDLSEMIRRSRSEGFGAEVKRRILTGTFVLSQGYYDAYYLQAQRVRRLIQQDFQQALTECDLILGPVSPTVAFDLGEKTSDPVQMYLSDIFTLSANLAGLPALSIPVGLGEKNRPVGLQIIGDAFSEGAMLSAAHAYQQVTSWHQQLPALARGAN